MYIWMLLVKAVRNLLVEEVVEEARLVTGMAIVVVVVAVDVDDDVDDIVGDDTGRAVDHPLHSGIVRYTRDKIRFPAQSTLKMMMVVILALHYLLLGSQC